MTSTVCLTSEEEEPLEGVKVMSVIAPSMRCILQGLVQGQTLVRLPRRCQLTYDSQTKPEVLSLIQQVPPELWSTRLALQVGVHACCSAVLTHVALEVLSASMRRLPVSMALLSSVTQQREPLCTS